MFYSMSVIECGRGCGAEKQRVPMVTHTRAHAKPRTPKNAGFMARKIGKNSCHVSQSFAMSRLVWRTSLQLPVDSVKT